MRRKRHYNPEVNRKKAVLRIVTAPNRWSCNVCGGIIEAGEKCGKRGRQRFCLSCLEKVGERGNV